MKHLLIILSFTSLILSGCVTTKNTSNSDNQSVTEKIAKSFKSKKNDEILQRISEEENIEIYVYRTCQLLGLGVNTRLFINFKEIKNLKNCQMTYMEMPDDDFTPAPIYADNPNKFIFSVRFSKIQEISSMLMPTTGPIKLGYGKNDFIKRLGDNQLKIWANKKLYGNIKYENNILSFEKTFLHSYYFIVTVKDRGKDILVQKVNKEDFLYTYRKDKFSLNLFE